jgi:hypothetical protein
LREGAASGTPVGHLNIKWAGNDAPEVRAHLPGAPELSAVGVWPPEMRSHGIGRKLIEAAEGMAKAKGYSRFLLGVEVANHRARRLYQRLGYQDWAHGKTVPGSLLTQGLRIAATVIDDAGQSIDSVQYAYSALLDEHHVVAVTITGTPASGQPADIGPAPLRRSSAFRVNIPSYLVLSGISTAVPSAV